MRSEIVAPTPAAWIGTDEAGKGDYFGPLVVAGVFVQRAEIDALRALGVDDSKRLDDAMILAMAPTLRARFAHEICALSPADYNALYPQFKNLNHLLAWAHGRVVEGLIERTGAGFVLTDQFTRVETMWRHFGPRGRAACFQQRPRAEDDPGVAAASVLARAAFLEGVAALATTAGASLPLGAGAVVDKAARRLVATQGRAALGRVAKLHFKNTLRVASS